METDFLGMPGVDVWLFAGLSLASFLTTFLGMVTGAAGGLLLLMVLATVFPPVVLVPLHTAVQLGSNIGRIMMMHEYILRPVLIPFVVGAIIGGIAGAQIFVALPARLLQGIIASFALFALWVPQVGSFGPERGRFAMVGFLSTFIGVFVSATGTLVAPFINKASRDRRNYVATFSTLMAITHIAKMSAFLLAGVAIGIYAPLMASMIASMVLATWLGRKVLDRVPEKLFRGVLKIVLTLLALRLLWVAADLSRLF